MINTLLKKLTASKSDAFSGDETQLALAALMVRVARADGDYADSEKHVIDKVLMTRDRLSQKEAAALRTEAEDLEASAPDTVRFTRAIKDGVAYEDRAQIVEALWAVVLADGVRDHEENAQLRLLANLLGINDRDSALARQRVEATR